MSLFGFTCVPPPVAGFRTVSVWLFSLTLIVFSLAGSHLHADGFELNFEKHSPPQFGTNFTQLNCNRGEGDVFCGARAGSGNDLTPILLEYVVIDGVEYSHQIIGDPDTGWVQEVYLDRFGSAVCENVGCFNNDPMGSAENAKGFPTMSVIRQLMTSTVGDETFTMEFLKDKLLNKAKLTNSLVSSKINYFFESDGRELDFTAANIANKAPLVMSFTILDEFIPPSIDTGGPVGGNYNYATDQDNSIVDAGQVSFDAATGVYTHFDPASGFNIDQDWSSFFDLSQNLDCNTVRPECP